jgi:chromosome segregation ATPase
LKLSEEDATTIDELKKQVERAWTMVEAANTREEVANGTIERQAAELAQLTLLVQKQTAMLGADTSLEDLIAARDTLAARLREAEAAVATERARADELTAEVTLRAEKAKERKAHIKELEREIKNRAADEAREAKKRAVMEADMAKLRDQLAAAGAAAAADKKKAEEAEEKSGRLEKQLATQRFTMTQSLGDFQKLQASTTKLAEQLDEAVMRADALSDEKAKVERELKAVREELAREKAALVRAAAKAEADAKERDRLTRLADDEKLEVAKVSYSFLLERLH